MIRITSKLAGFRRCGVAHPAGPVDYPDERWAFAELEALKADPMLGVTYIKESPADPLPPEGEQDTASAGTDEADAGGEAMPDPAAAEPVEDQPLPEKEVTGKKKGKGGSK